MMTSNQSLVLSCLCLLLTFDALHLASGQAYHFSKGWMPGRKRTFEGLINSVQTPNIYDGDSPSTVDLKAASSACEVRPRVKEMITQLVKDELRRLEEDCSEINLGGGRTERVIQDIFIKRRALQPNNWQSYSTTDE